MRYSGRVTPTGGRHGEGHLSEHCYEQLLYYYDYYWCSDGTLGDLVLQSSEPQMLGISTTVAGVSGTEGFEGALGFLCGLDFGLFDYGGVVFLLTLTLRAWSQLGPSQPALHPLCQSRRRQAPSA